MSDAAQREAKIFSFIRDVLKLNTAVACGIIANMYHETTDFDPNKTNKKNGAYGICQWLGGRKTRLLKFCETAKIPPNSLDSQLKFLEHELVNNVDVKKMDDGRTLIQYFRELLNTEEGSYNAGYYFSYKYERPGSNAEELRAASCPRGNTAKQTYWKKYKDSKTPTYSSTPTAHNDIGQDILKVARSCLGAKYSMEKRYQNPEYFDCSSFVTYCYKKVGINLKGSTSIGIYNSYKNTAKEISPSEMKAGDLIFYLNTSSDLSKGRTPPITHIALANGEGGRIHAGSPVQENRDTFLSLNKQTGRKEYYKILRVLDDLQTSGSSYSIENTGDYVSLSEAMLGTGTSGLGPLDLVDIYKEQILTNLERAKSAGFDYGYLIDLTNGGEFKFYIPEFSESAGANWSDVSIRGRSVSVKSYESTNSRSVTISLDLFAGSGLYEKKETGNTDVVGDLHRDATFLKSLEYPDYTLSIVTPPPTVQLILGSAFNLTGIVSNVTVEHMKPLDEQNRSMYLKVGFTVTQIASNPPDWREIREGSTSTSSSTSKNSQPLASDKVGIKKGEYIM